ncbi:uncharacterized protein EI90DRAFT_3021472 [Cantharellus anzutake]|uniref:uncharacterized protein n=1 Tax=Cantharellus anzutake TaxID=1750568 RepID=UPI001903A15E|nr:uncharacterized protein EI90DRAFT_3021472 [Cantharellus anzutake]KAF8316930.1 hypothetical protein EI90DRAFT_3021472 [Cantharellus anzutake]
MVIAGQEFSREYKFGKDNHHKNFKDIPQGLFKLGQLSLAYWHPIGYKHQHPVISKEAGDCLPANKKFQKYCEAFYHILNIYTVQLAPKLAKRSQEVWQWIRSKHDPKGYLSEIKSHFFAQTIRFNANTHFHCDSASCWCGFNAVARCGKYKGCLLEFPGLGESVPQPKDLGKTYGKDDYKKFRQLFPCHQPSQPEPGQSLK